MKPSIHSNLSVRKYGGIPSDYQEVHDFLDMSKMTHSDLRHRCILHNTLGPFLAEKGIGVNHSKAEYLKEKYSQNHLLHYSNVHRWLPINAFACALQKPTFLLVDLNTIE